MEKNFWHQRWQEGRIGFHQADINAYLTQYWSYLDISEGAQILVPLCGKSRDMLWLREQGYAVLGVELSDIACRDFFLEAGEEVEAVTLGNYHRRERDGITLLCADLFELPWELFKPVKAVYDRAALIALPEEMRQRYAERMAQRLQSGVKVLLISLEHNLQSGTPFSVPEVDVRALFEPAFTVERLDSWDEPDERGCREVVYCLTRQ